MLKFTEFAFDSICSIQDDLFAGNVDREKLTCSIKQIFYPHPCAIRFHKNFIIPNNCSHI